MVREPLRKTSATIGLIASVVFGQPVSPNFGLCLGSGAGQELLN